MADITTIQPLGFIENKVSTMVDIYLKPLSTNQTEHGRLRL
jgi:hypothetical protein